ncbi:MAG TPA: response regulator [Tepidisphaeraceae bacterium]|nr:response regulator [Tepidisphaeraceae bacterium]
MSSTINMQVAVIDDDFAQRTTVARLIQSVGLTTTLYESAEEFLDSCSTTTTCCVLTDMRMPGMSGLQLQHELANRDVHIPLIVLTGHADVPAAVRSMKAGAYDFIEKPCNPQILLETVQGAMRQSEHLRRQQEETRVTREHYATLTPRERQVMRLVVDGVSNKNIAQQLKLSEKTIEFHRSKVMTKMAVESVADLVRQSFACPGASVADQLPSGTVYRELGKTPA